MLRPFAPVLIVIAAVLAQGCSTEHSQPAPLRDHAAAVCKGSPGLVVSVRADGRYGLNSGVLDSAQLVQALHDLVPPRPDKLVMVRADAGPEAALRWVVPAIAHAGGTAYEFDQACLHPVTMAQLAFR